MELESHDAVEPTGGTDGWNRRAGPTPCVRQDVVREHRNIIVPYDLFPQYRRGPTLSQVIGGMPSLEWGQIGGTDFYHAFRTYRPVMRAWIHDLKGVRVDPQVQSAAEPEADTCDVEAVAERVRGAVLWVRAHLLDGGMGQVGSKGLLKRSLLIAAQSHGSSLRLFVGSWHVLCAVFVKYGSSGGGPFGGSLGNRRGPAGSRGPLSWYSSTSTASTASTA